MQCKTCGSYAINHHLHGRDGSCPDLCDVCYWRSKVEPLKLALEAEQAWRDATGETSDDLRILATKLRKQALSHFQPNE